jgi:cytochrome oxidase Cu insertion factor (SCO1/SenC/PrrC family)
MIFMQSLISIRPALFTMLLLTCGLVSAQGVAPSPAQAAASTSTRTSKPPTPPTGQAVQGGPAVGAKFDLQASDPAGARFDVNQLKDKVAIVFYWSTDCAVCRNNLPELRANLAGWRNKPFALVTVNVDRASTDWRAYEHIVNQMQPGQGRLMTLWQDPAVAAPRKLPLTLVLDKKGQVVARYEGRMAPEAWDAVAELLL